MWNAPPEPPITTAAPPAPPVSKTTDEKSEEREPGEIPLNEPAPASTQ